MSTTIDIVCMDCRESLWIGQIHRGEGESHLNLYADRVDAMGEDLDGDQGDTQKQRRFYAKHIGHVLMCTYDEATTDIADNEFEHDEDHNEGPVEHRNLDESEWRDTVNAGIERVLRSNVLVKKPRKGTDGNHALLYRRQGEQS